MSQNQDQPEGVVSTGGRRYVFVHSRLNEISTEELDEVVAYLANDADARRYVETPGRPDGVRFALGIAAAWVREQARSRDGTEG